MSSVLVQYRDSATKLWHAQEVLQLQTDFLTDGITNHRGDRTDFLVQANSPVAMNVVVNSGRMYMGVLVSGEFRRERMILPTNATLAVTSNALGTNRIDAVVVVNNGTVAPDAEGDNCGDVRVIAGDGVTALSDAEIDTAVGAGKTWKRLANITVANGAISISSGNIADTRGAIGDFVNITDINFLLASGFYLRGVHPNGDILNVMRVTASGADNFAEFTEEYPRIDPALGDPAQDHELVTKKYVDDQNALQSGATMFQVRYGDGSDGTPTWTAGATLDPDTVYNYETATLPVSQSIITDEDNKVLRIRVRGDMTINGTLDLKGRGGAKGAKGTKATGSGNNNATSGSDGTGGKDVLGQTIAGGGGGGGRGTATNGQGQASGGGGGASVKGNGSIGTSAGAWAPAGAGGVLDDLLMRILANIEEYVCCGGGGGGGGGSGWPAPNAQGGDGSDGGDGGGAAIIDVGGDLYLGVDSVIDCRGDNSANGTSYGSGNPSGEGAPGAGGCVIIRVGGSIIDSGVSLLCTAGSKGSDSGSQTDSGNAKDGRIIIYSMKDGNYLIA